jgi:hypothetical protein
LSNRNYFKITSFLSLGLRKNNTSSWNIEMNEVKTEEKELKELKEGK